MIDFLNGTRQYLMIAILAWVGVNAAAGEVDDVIAKHIAARGGLENWQAVKSMTLTGTYTGFSLPAPFALQRKRPNKYHFDHHLGDKPVLIAYDGKTGWWLNPWFEIAWPVLLPEPDYNVMVQDAEFATPFFNHAEAGYQVTYEGEGELEGQRGLLLKLVRPSGEEETWYIDPETHLEFARISTGSNFGQPAKMVTYFSDFREVQGLVMPFLIEAEFHTRHRVMEIDQIVINPAVADEIFAKPAPEGMADWFVLAGDWTVKVERRGYPGAPWRESAAQSRIERLIGGALLQESLRFGGNDSTELVRGLSYDRFRKAYRVTQVDNFTTHPNLFEGVLADGKLTVSNQESDTSWEGYGRTIHERLTYSEVGPTSFVVEREVSTNGGENWFLNLKLSYSRGESGQP